MPVRQTAWCSLPNQMVPLGIFPPKTVTWISQPYTTDGSDIELCAAEAPEAFLGGEYTFLGRRERHQEVQNPSSE